jgi:hypothetical protein
MGKKAETSFKEIVLKDLAALPNGFFEKIQQVGKRGTPDILGCLNGYAVVIELKKDAKAKPDKLQRHKLKKYEKACALVFVAFPENWNELYKRLITISLEGKYGNSDHRREVERGLFSQT